MSRAMALTGYPSSRVHLVKGRVEDTIREEAPELMIIDDYGWWRGQREATDEYFGEHPPRPFLTRVDDGGVGIAGKPD